jgi:hypothetical protein
MECPDCEIKMICKGTVEVNESGSGFLETTELWQCPKCKNVEIK